MSYFGGVERLTSALKRMEGLTLSPCMLTVAKLLASLRCPSLDRFLLMLPYEGRGLSSIKHCNAVVGV